MFAKFDFKHAQSVSLYQICLQNLIPTELFIVTDLLAKFNSKHAHVLDLLAKFDSLKAKTGIRQPPEALHALTGPARITFGP